jgi:Asp-tRNA(Asn)/Glu-tRNA(Gln) amidotransferase A subunit family amidase
MSVDLSWSIGEAAAALGAGRCTSSQYVKALLDRIVTFGPTLNAIVHLNRLALNEAERLDKLRAEGKILGPLHGIPLLVKDNINVAGMPTTACTPALRNNIPSKSSAAIKILQDAGAIILGKTNLSELACSFSTNNTSWAGPCHNPYKLDHSSGGSSGGSAAAVAASFVPAAIMSDTLGSVICPSHACGIYGFRPTTGRYSTSGVLPLLGAFDTLGSGARCVSDLQLLDGLLSGDATEFRVDVRGLRIAAPHKFLYEGLARDVAEAMAQSLAKLEAAGVHLVTVDLPCDVRGNFGLALSLGPEAFEKDIDAYLAAETADSNNPLAGEQLNFRGLLAAISNPVTKRICEHEADPTAEELAALPGLKQRRADQNELFRKWFADNRLDGAFFPACSQTAPLLSNGDMADIALYRGRLGIASVNSLPALNLPVGIGKDGLPMGAELLGAPGSDRRTLEIARHFEAIIGRIAPPILK